MFLWKVIDVRSYPLSWFFIPGSFNLCVFIFLFQGSAEIKIESIHSSDGETVGIKDLDDSQDTDQVLIWMGSLKSYKHVKYSNNNCF